MFNVLLTLSVSALMVLGACIAVPNALPARIQPGSWSFFIAVVVVAIVLLAVSSLLQTDRL